MKESELLVMCHFDIGSHTNLTFHSCIMMSHMLNYTLLTVLDVHGNGSPNVMMNKMILYECFYDNDNNIYNYEYIYV